MLYCLGMLLESCELLEKRFWVVVFVLFCSGVVFYVGKFLHQSCCLLIRELEEIIRKIHSFHWSLAICLISSALPSWQHLVCNITVTCFITFLYRRPAFNSHHFFSLPLWFITTTRTWDDLYIWERVPARRCFNPLCWQPSMSSSWETIIDYSGGKTPSQHQLAARPCPRAPELVPNKILSRDSVTVNKADIIRRPKTSLYACSPEMHSSLALIKSRSSEFSSGYSRMTQQYIFSFIGRFE